MQRDRLFVQTHNRFLGIVRRLVSRQDVLHLRDIFFIEIGPGRGRDAGHPAPPAQIPTSGTTA